VPVAVRQLTQCVDELLGPGLDASLVLGEGLLVPTIPGGSTTLSDGTVPNPVSQFPDRLVVGLSCLHDGQPAQEVGEVPRVLPDGSGPDQVLPTIRQRYIVTVSTKGAS
jgi:hypothetical protein